ncbi:MAG: cohesin domain-containing protein, partial [Acutalibacteraceae bacterium]
MKKLIALCLTIMLVLVAVPVIGATAADSGEFVVSTAEAHRGETVDVTVSINNNPGIVSAKVKVAYDSNVLEFDSKQDGVFAGVAYSPDTANPFIINWIDTIHGLNTTNGTLVTLTFKVKDAAAFGQSPITLSFDPDDVYDLNFDNVDFTTVDGYVDVVCVHEGGKADCSNKAVCDICGESYGEFGDHAYTEKVDDKYLKSAATCTSKAVYYKSCSVCGEKGTETFEDGEVLPHAYTEKVDDKYLKSAATC